MQRSFAFAAVLCALACVACDRREDPRVEPTSQGSGSPPGDIVDPGPTASAEAGHVPQPRTSDARRDGEGECEPGEACEDTPTPDVER